MPIRRFPTIYMDADPDSAARLERLLASDRRGRVLWNHCGSNAAAADVRPLLALNPNLFCELSFRYPPVLRIRLIERFPRRMSFDLAGPAAAWLRLIEDFPDRFMIGTDAHSPEEHERAIRMVRAPVCFPSCAWRRRAESLTGTPGVCSASNGGGFPIRRRSARARRAGGGPRLDCWDTHPAPCMRKRRRPLGASCERT